MVNDKGRKSLPPYVSYRTFRSFIDGLQVGIPSRIDRSYWGERYSGSTGTQLMTALRFLGLVDSDGLPTTRLRQLVSSKGAQRYEVMRQIAHSSFDFLTERSLDPQVATYAQLEDAFGSAYQMTGDVTRKCIKFFISMENDAGVTLSPFITKKSKAIRTNTGKRGNTKKLDLGTNRNAVASPGDSTVPTESNWYGMVLAKFPALDPTWSDEIKLKWFDAFDSLLKRGTASGVEK